MNDEPLHAMVIDRLEHPLDYYEPNASYYVCKNSQINEKTINIYDNDILEAFFLSILPKHPGNCLMSNVSQNRNKGNNFPTFVGSSTINTQSRSILK